MAHSYITLLNAIAEGDRAKISDICEGNLSKAISKGLDDLNQTTKVGVMNGSFDVTDTSEIERLFEMEVIDSDSFIGPNIDREANKSRDF